VTAIAVPQMDAILFVPSTAATSRD
jgi:hypothetical protein